MLATRKGVIIAAVGCVLFGAGHLHLDAAQGEGAAQVPPSRSVQSKPQSSVQTSPSGSARALLSQYCITCHNARARTAGLVLEEGEVNVDRIADDAAIWEKVVQKLRAGSMPPAGLPRPDGASYDELATWLEQELDRAAMAIPNPGRSVVHRLNRLEYTNAIRDLLDLEIDGRALLPTDESGYGFDNIADVLSMSPALFSRYMIAAQKISRLVVGDDEAIRSTVTTYKVPSHLPQDERISDELPMGSRGGAVIRRYFPFDGEYALRIHLKDSFDNSAILGLDNREQLDVRLDGARIIRFTVGGECGLSTYSYSRIGDSATGSREPRCIKPPGAAQASEYEVTADQHLRVRFPAKAGARVVGVSFVKNRVTATEGAGPDHPPMGVQNERARPTMGIASVTIEGPFNASGSPDTASRRRLFVCRPSGANDEESCASTILGTLARRAYRRPVTAQDLQPLLRLYRRGRNEGGFDRGIQSALEGLLVSPDFLLRIEREPKGAAPGTVYSISDIDLASQLSFFLWSSIPDDELLDVAVRGELRDPAILEQQVRRMLADSRSSTLITNFASQWLYLRDLRVATPDTNGFPEFDEGLRQAFQRETDLFLESQLREDRPLGELLTANYTFLNERLAKFYGVPNIYGAHFRRVTISDPNRHGLLGHGSILTVTSYATRTSPVLRGKFVLDNILGAPPPPPPPDVPDLKEAGEGAEPLTTVRARMEAHRENAVCASCHARMDPIGFALENFNAIGKWRTTEFDIPIDSAGTFQDGTKFDGPVGLRNVLISRKQDFAIKASERLLTYGLGRGLEHYDRPSIRKIIRGAAETDYRWSSLILGVVDSVPFQMRVGP